MTAKQNRVNVWTLPPSIVPTLRGRRETRVRTPAAK